MSYNVSPTRIEGNGHQHLVRACVSRKLAVPIERKTFYGKGCEVETTRGFFGSGKRRRLTDFFFLWIKLKFSSLPLSIKLCLSLLCAKLTITEEKRKFTERNGTSKVLRERYLTIWILRQRERKCLRREREREREKREMRNKSRFFTPVRHRQREFKEVPRCRVKTRQIFGAKKSGRTRANANLN